MRNILIAFLFLSFIGKAQTNIYNISFDNAVHHEAKITASFPEVKTNTLNIRMSRTSPGRYALHEFVKNVYGFKATNSKGENLKITRKDPYSWQVSDHDGTVNIEYTLFANRGDGTYSQIDETHAHLNIPATFMYAEEFEHRPIEVSFNVREDLNWKVATQLKQKSGNTYTAPDLYYFMDSPTEISDFSMKSFDLDGQEIQFVLHHLGTESEFSEYFDQVEMIVKQEKAVYNELPEFDYGKYTFLACYMPNVSGDGMEHRNSTILTDTDALADGGMRANIGTVAHEFFHAWNVERIRPAELEPFDFTEANMTGSLWFAEGFTSYYTGLMLCRAKVRTPEEYIKSLNGTFNYVWNSPAVEYFNPMEMSYQATFVDAATSVDPTNRENTFISYYSYGSILGLALDLSLREKDLNLDDFMKLMWKKYGKNEVAYKTEDIESSLKEYAGEQFGTEFFENYIYNSQMPDYSKLFKTVGIKLERSQENDLGVSVSQIENGLRIDRNLFKTSAAYKAGLASGDIITSVNGTQIDSEEQLDELIKEASEEITVGYLRLNTERTAKVNLENDPTYTISLDENASKEALKNRESWLKTK